MEQNEIMSQAQALTQELSQLMGQIAAMTSQDRRFPNLTDAFRSAKSAVDNPSYDIVVCGEMKKGKSTLLNAIIGRDILPVANQVATSQVFRISNSPEESFELVFIDGTRKRISREDLSTYGSQVDANLHGTLGNEFQGKVLDYIQVNTPVDFLPEGVNLIDTPGLGAVYKSHEYITRNYVRRAAGVVFVFDPERPLVEGERDFIRKVLEVTPHIMFVMTKIDMYRADVWHGQLTRTQESLNVLFAEHNLPAPEVFPMSSALLSEAARETAEDFRAENVRESMFPDVKDELMRIILKSVGLMHTSRALFESQAQIIKVKKVITDLQAAASTEGQQLDARYITEKQQLQQRLEQEWGRNSAKNRELADEITTICNTVVINKVQQMFRPTGSIRAYYQNAIDSLSDMDQVAKLCEELPHSLVNDISSQWQSIMEDAKETVSGMLNDRLSSIEGVSYGNLRPGNTDIAVRRLSVDEKIANYRNQYFTGMFLTTIAVAVCPPLAPIVGALAGVWAYFSGRRRNDEQLLQQNKNNLSRNLANALDEMSRQLLDVQPGKTRSVVNEFVHQLKKSAESALAESVEAQKQQMRQQLTDMEEQARKTIDQKRAELQSLNIAMNNWQELVPKTGQLAELYNQIDSSVNNE